MAWRVALGSIFIECNHFGGAPASLDVFRRSELAYGDEILSRTTGTVGGMLEVLRSGGTQVLPLLVASGCPSGPVTANAYAHLKSEMLERLRQAGPVDGVLLALHGSAAVAGFGHLESDLLTAVRQAVGDAVPVVATLDLHAHVTEDMVSAADALIAWETYPHRDALETGQRGGRALLDILGGALRPAMVLAKVPVLVSGVLGHTSGPGPFADIMRFAKSREGMDGVYSTSVFLVHPYLDLPDMGGGGLVITDGDPTQAAALAGGIAEQYWDRRRDLEPPVFEPPEAIRRGLEIEGGPVLLVETADCCGGGAAGDSVATLKALLAADVQEPSLVSVVDPIAAGTCHQAGVGAEVSLQLGHQVDPAWGTPVSVRGVVRHLSNGGFTYRGGIWDGQTANMGLSARVVVGAIEIGIASHPTYEWCGEQFELLGMDPRTAKFVVVKNPMNYHMAFGPFATGEFILRTPGPTPATLRGVKFQNVRPPYYPAWEEIPGIRPRIYRGRWG